MGNRVLSVLKKTGSGLLVVAGFFAIIFSATKLSRPNDAQDLVGTGVAHADAPYSQATYYAEGAYSCGDSGGSGDSGDSGSGDSGGGC